MQNIVGHWLLSLKQYLLMSLLLSSPAKLPYNTYCVLLTVFAYFALGLLLVDEQRGYGLVCAQIILELGMLALIAYLGLRWKNNLPRFQQTFSALAGINLVITAITIPVYRATTGNQDSMENLIVYATLIILMWNLAVLSLIFKRAFEIPTQLSAMISFGYFVVYQFVVVWIY
ncbi:MAG: hypothetical protein OEN02_09280 [Gammaproteobacteria bacterium]|nr:hypothetical protein [Gammaproteobacteria bacterium]MDH3388086.1 hypothetical protein [Gammaproteobacteria bacterium]